MELNPGNAPQLQPRCSIRPGTLLSAFFPAQNTAACSSQKEDDVRQQMAASLTSSLIQF